MPANSGRIFLDTNLFVYSLERTNVQKRERSRELIIQAQVEGNGVISYQVIHELANVALKSRFRLTPNQTRQVIENLCEPLEIVPTTLAMVHDALLLHEQFQLSWFDSLIVAAARTAHCEVLLSEDFQPGQQFGPVRVQSPFDGLTS